MTRQISLASYVLVLVSALTFAGCGGGGGEATFTPPTDEVSAADKQAADDYEAQMEADNARQRAEQ